MLIVWNNIFFVIKLNYTTDKNIVKMCYWYFYLKRKLLLLTLAGEGLGLVGLLVVIVTPIFPLSFERTSAFRLRSILAKSGRRSSLLELFELSFSGIAAGGVGVTDGVSSVPKMNTRIITLLRFSDVYCNVNRVLLMKFLIITTDFLRNCYVLEKYFVFDQLKQFSYSIYDKI